ncbi:Hypothetical protein NTJ_10069 [Nesidiocoris tenuis]|uniref:Uncharacterized protein n=1 Tax=Nesidiocoris tenuis TaxID=355587 RepID=A0ABN7AYJ9_9HEMI|nr:Hypothetical protein NTJ_10069 [Nesidiocoris tenuis]
MDTSSRGRSERKKEREGITSVRPAVRIDWPTGLKTGGGEPPPGGPSPSPNDWHRLYTHLSPLHGFAPLCRLLDIPTASLSSSRHSDCS